MSGAQTVHCVAIVRVARAVQPQVNVSVANAPIVGQECQFARKVSNLLRIAYLNCFHSANSSSCLQDQSSLITHLPHIP